MAHALTLGAWQGQDVSVSEIVDALERLRHESQRTATRTSVVSLVAIASDEDEAQRACDAMHALGVRHPGRTIVVRREPDAPAGIDAEVTLHAGSAEGVAVWSEDVVTTVRGPAAAHLDSLIEPLTLPDLPLACWFVATRPTSADVLADSADIVIVDSKELGDVDAYGELLPLSRRRTVIDLSWMRLTPWRLLLAGLFEGAVYRPFVRGVKEAVVSGKPGPRHLLGGWLAARLDLGEDVVRLADARHASFALTAEHQGRTARFVTERRGDERLVRASAAVDGGPSHEELLPLPDPTLAWAVAEALSNLEGDPIYGEALEAALQFAR